MLVQLTAFIKATTKKRNTTTNLSYLMSHSLGQAFEATFLQLSITFSVTHILWFVTFMMHASLQKIRICNNILLDYVKIIHNRLYILSTFL